MACPNCGCKVHYQFNDADFGPDDERLERCAACSAVFDIEDAAEDDDEAECSTVPAGVSPTADQTFSRQSPMNSSKSEG